MLDREKYILEAKWLAQPFIKLFEEYPYLFVSTVFSLFSCISLFHDTYSKGKSSADLKIIECGLVTTCVYICLRHRGIELLIFHSGCDAHAALFTKNNVRKPRNCAVKRKFSSVSNI